MQIEEILLMCKVTGKSKTECEKARDAIYSVYDSLSKEEQEVVADALEELEMAIEWME